MIFISTGFIQVIIHVAFNMFKRSLEAEVHVYLHHRRASLNSILWSRDLFIHVPVQLPGEQTNPAFWDLFMSQRCFNVQPTSYMVDRH